MFELFIARRYLRAKRKQVVISLITVISVIGVAAGVMALIIALSINNGYRSTLERSFLGITAHVMILDKSGEGIRDWGALAEKLHGIPQVESVTPSLYDFALLAGNVTSKGVQIKGIAPESQQALPGTLQRLKSGDVRRLWDAGEMPGIILGSKLAEDIGATVGTTVRLILPNGEVTPFDVRASTDNLQVVGTFESSVFDIDSLWAYMPLKDMQRVFGFGDVVNSIELNLKDVYSAPEVAKQAQAMIGPDLEATTWQEQNRNLLEAFRMERIVTIVTIGLIQLVAALNILITLVMMVMEKHRDIAVLMSMGARAAQIRRIFVLKGGIIGAIGTVVGLIVGYTLSFLADRYQWLSLDETVYSLSYVPLQPRWTDGLWVAAAAMVVSLIATLYPARSATRIEPVEAMRYE
jgi:lipoprotein-releasing system permease protein